MLLLDAISYNFPKILSRFSTFYLFLSSGCFFFEIIGLNATSPSDSKSKGAGNETPRVTKW